MKRLLGLLVCAFIFNSCDDGDIKIKKVSFEDITSTSSCDDIIFKVNGNELMLIKITNANTLAYINEVGTRSFPISAANKVIYRSYDGVPNTENICSTPPAATPNVLEEWNAIGGTIEITTTAVEIETNATTNATQIKKYNHYIVFKNIVFQKSDGNQTYDTFVFGNHTTNTKLIYPFGTQLALKKCDTSNIVYSQTGAEALIINNIDSSLIENTPTSSARIMALSNTTNKLSYKIYDGTIPLNFFCGTLTTPTLSEEWIPDYTATSGTIEVTTTVATSGSTTEYTHEIHLKNVTLMKGTISFYLGDDYYYGDLILE